MLGTLYTHTHACTHTHTRTCTHATHTHASTCAHTHTHTHKLKANTVWQLVSQFSSSTHFLILYLALLPPNTYAVVACVVSMKLTAFHSFTSRLEWIIGITQRDSRLYFVLWKHCVHDERNRLMSPFVWPSSQRLQMFPLSSAVVFLTAMHTTRVSDMYFVLLTTFWAFVIVVFRNIAASIKRTSINDHH